MTELGIIALTFLGLYILLLALNYKAFTEYPDRLREYGFGRNILESKGPLWFIIAKAGMFLVFFLAFTTLALFLPSRYSYLFFGVLLGVLWFNFLHDYMQYKQAKSERARIFLDTGALIALSGLEGKELELFKRRLETSRLELSITHIQVDEKTTAEIKPYQSKIDKAVRSLSKKGITVKLEDSKITVVGISRVGYTRLGYEDMHELDDRLRTEIVECEKAHGRFKPLLNVARDAAIAVSSLNHEFFVVCDRCLLESWYKVLGKRKVLGWRFKVPTIVYAKPHPKEVAEEIIGLPL